MVQMGSAVEMCHGCLEIRVCGEFWDLDPRFRAFWCVDCLERMLAGVRAAQKRYAITMVKQS